MQKIFFLLLLAVQGTSLRAQQQYYLYVQANASQPFYARIQNTIFSSSENGYLIIPKLHDSTYDVFIGFARNVFPEQHFSIQINKQDQGFELKNLGEKGWGLQNLQSTAVVMNTNPAQRTVTDNTGEKKNDAFSQMLANVVNDSAILYTAAKPVSAVPPPPKKTAVQEPPEEKKKDTVAAFTPPAQAAAAAVTGNEKKPPPDSTTIVKTEKKDSLPVLQPEKHTVVSEPVSTLRPDSGAAKKETAEKPFITRIQENKNTEGYRAVYIEQYIFSTDTIRIEIPVKEAAPAMEKTTPPVSSQKPPDTAAVAAPPALIVAADTPAKKKQGLVVTNSDCTNFATDNDVDKLRVKVLAENAIDDKLVVARKYFKAKCFSVKQVKALTELFPSDESKYRFFDVAYPFVSDTENFSSLDELIQNEYFKTRFKAMIRK